MWQENGRGGDGKMESKIIVMHGVQQNNLEACLLDTYEWLCAVIIPDAKTKSSLEDEK